MALKEWTITYFLRGNAPADDGCTFGCSAEGIAGDGRMTAAGWGIKPMGEVLGGTYGGVLVELDGLTGSGFRPDAAVVFFAKAPGMEEFLRQASRLLPGIPFGGGGAAFDAARGSGELLPAVQDVALLLIKDDRYLFSNVWRNVHDETGGKVCFRAGGDRTILALREESDDLPAQTWYSETRKMQGFREGSFENLALASPEGWNLHASPEGRFALHTGADLPYGGELAVRSVSDETATERVCAFCGKESTLVFGCAGLRSLLIHNAEPGKNTLAGFLHGEVLTVAGGPRFTNLMMSALKAEIK